MYVICTYIHTAYSLKIYMIVKYNLALLKNFLVSQLVILSAGMLILISLLKSVILMYSYCRE